MLWAWGEGGEGEGAFCDCCLLRGGSSPVSSVEYTHYFSWYVTIQIITNQHTLNTPRITVPLMVRHASLRSTTQHDAARRSTTQHDAARRSTTQHYAALRSTTQHYAALRSTTQHYATLPSTTPDHPASPAPRITSAFNCMINSAHMG